MEGSKNKVRSNSRGSNSNGMGGGLSSSSSSREAGRREADTGEEDMAETEKIDAEGGARAAAAARALARREAAAQTKKETNAAEGAGAAARVAAARVMRQQPSSNTSTGAAAEAAAEAAAAQMARGMINSSNSSSSRGPTLPDGCECRNNNCHEDRNGYDGENPWEDYIDTLVVAWRKYVWIKEHMYGSVQGLHWGYYQHDQRMRLPHRCRLALHTRFAMAPDGEVDGTERDHECYAGDMTMVQYAAHMRLFPGHNW